MYVIWFDGMFTVADTRSGDSVIPPPSVCVLLISGADCSTSGRPLESVTAPLDTVPTVYRSGANNGEAAVAAEQAAEEGAEDDLFVVILEPGHGGISDPCLVPLSPPGERGEG